MIPFGSAPDEADVQLAYVLAASAVLALINFAFNDQVLPRTNHQLRMLTVDIARKKPTFELKEQMINPVIPGRYYLRASRIDQASSRLREVVIYDLANPDRRRTIHADSGFMRFVTIGTGLDLHLTLFDGFVHDYDRAQPAVFRRVFFRTDWVRMRGVSNEFQRSNEDAFKGDREMSVCEMEKQSTIAHRALVTARKQFQMTLALANKRKVRVSRDVLRTKVNDPISIGLGTARWWKSILWGFVIAVVSAVAVGALAYVTGYGHGPGSAAFEKLPLWLITAIVFRAGVVEELFYRGYAIERLQLIGLSRVWAVAIPLVIFSLGHWTGGAANILIAFVAALILTGFYLWRRDLVANMIGHGLVDFVANVLPKLF